jgi:hypothetical protein
MGHLLAKHSLPHINIALVLAVVWAAFAVGEAIYDVGRMIEAW